MTQPLWVATRKGLFQLRAEHGWRIDTPAFLGDPVAMVLDDPRDGTVYAALDLGHFGAKRHRLADRGATWEEVAVPFYTGLPDITKAAGTGGEAPAPEPPTLKMLCALEAGGADQPRLGARGSGLGRAAVTLDTDQSWFRAVRSLFSAVGH